MHRQSFGSPGFKFPIRASFPGEDGDEKRGKAGGVEVKAAASSSSSSAAAPPLQSPEKPIRHGCARPPHASVHLIPLLIAACFFVLYIFSHDPSAEDLLRFHGDAARILDRQAGSAAVNGGAAAAFGRLAGGGAATGIGGRQSLTTGRRGRRLRRVQQLRWFLL